MKLTIIAPRRDRHVDELAAAVGAALAIDVPIIEGGLADAPAEGYLLVFDTLGLADARDGARIIAVDVDRSTIMKRVEAQGFAAAVEKHRLFQWSAQRDKERGDGVVGRKDVAAKIGATFASGPYTSASYAWLSSPAATDLPGLLAAYLKAYAHAGHG